MIDIYQECPIYKKKLITLRLVMMEDADELLNCYSDEKAVPFFNSDNCHGDNFHYTTLERMREAINFWDFASERIASLLHKGFKTLDKKFMDYDNYFIISNL